MWGKNVIFSLDVPKIKIFRIELPHSGIIFIPILIKFEKKGGVLEFTC
jgi:hypothetical protein